MSDAGAGIDIVSPPPVRETQGIASNLAAGTTMKHLIAAAAAIAACLIAGAAEAETLTKAQTALLDEREWAVQQGFIVQFGIDYTDAVRRDVATASVRRELRHPDAAEFPEIMRRDHADGVVYCGRVDIGGYGNLRRFVTAGGHAVIEAPDSDPTFPVFWRKWCD